MKVYLSLNQTFLSSPLFDISLSMPLAASFLPCVVLREVFGQSVPPLSLPSSSARPAAFLPYRPDPASSSFLLARRLFPLPPSPFPPSLIMHFLQFFLCPAVPPPLAFRERQAEESFFPRNSDMGC